MAKLPLIDLSIVILYLAGMLVFGYRLGKNIQNDEDYFLGGKKLPWWAIGMSMVVSDIGALELVGLAGGAYTYGIAIANFDWIGCIPAMVVGAFVFIPYYWRSKVFTIPEFLGIRYNQFVRTLVAIIWGVFFMFMLGIFFFTAAKTMNILIGWPLYPSILIVALVVGGYTLVGGLTAVVYTDAIQCIILFVGSILILMITLFKAGGWHEAVATVRSLGPAFQNHFDLIAPANSPTPYGWAAILFGLAFVLSPAYWLGNQAIVQRTLGARSEYDAKKSVLWGAFLKLFIPFILVFPGVLGLALYPNLPIGDDIYPTLIRDLLPTGLTGLVFAAFLAALMSSVDSYLNSAATLWTKDIYQKYIKTSASEQHYMRVGRILTAVFVTMGVVLAPLTEKFQSIFDYMQTMLSIFQGPLLAILVLGLLWPRATGKGAVAGLLLGVGLSSLLFSLKNALFTCPEPFLYIAWWSFLFGLLMTAIVSLLTKPESPEKIKDVLFSKYQK